MWFNNWIRLSSATLFWWQPSLKFPSGLWKPSGKTADKWTSCKGVDSCPLAIWKRFSNILLLLVRSINLGENLEEPVQLGHCPTWCWEYGRLAWHGWAGRWPHCAGCEDCFPPAVSPPSTKQQVSSPPQRWPRETLNQVHQKQKSTV